MSACIHHAFYLLIVSNVLTIGIDSKAAEIVGFGRRGQQEGRHAEGGEGTHHFYFFLWGEELVFVVGSCLGFLCKLWLFGFGWLCVCVRVYFGM